MVIKMSRRNGIGNGPKIDAQMFVFWTVRNGNIGGYADQ